MIKELHLKIDIDKINNDLIKKLNDNFENTKNGNCHLKITIISNNNGKKISLDMISKIKSSNLTII